MTNLWQSFILAVASAAATGAGTVLDATSYVDLKTVITVGCIVFSGTWWVSNWMSHVRSDIEKINWRLDNLNCNECPGTPTREMKRNHGK